jgi:hypothetical protein
MDLLKTILPANSSPEEAVRCWNEFIKQNGELQNIETLGTSPLNQQGMQSFVRLKFKYAEGFYHVTWRNQKMHERDEDRLQPAVTSFVRKPFTEYPLELPFLPKTETDVCNLRFI